MCSTFRRHFRPRGGIFGTADLMECDCEFGLLLLGLSVSMNLDVFFEVYALIFLFFSLAMGLFISYLFSRADRRKVHLFQ
jgi:hypothetical protein